MTKIMLILFGTIIIAIGVVLLYDARKIAIKRFSSEETNSTTKILKISGIVISIIGLILISMI
jgi:uncharacterized protein YjeT (DUF2065 family)